jgi:hypothetical protein
MTNVKWVNFFEKKMIKKRYRVIDIKFGIVAKKQDKPINSCMLQKSITTQKNPVWLEEYARA